MAHILIIDDEDMVRMVLKQSLEKAGHAVTEASNGAKGIKALHDGNFDLIITDIVMPEKEGVETIAEIRASEPDLPIIAVSGGGRIGPENYLDAARKLGANHAFAKPFDRAELLGAVDQCLSAAAA